MSAALEYLAHRVDHVTLGVLVGFWLRWEVWRRLHRQEHDALQRLVPHEVTHA